MEHADLVQRPVEKLCARLEELRETQNPVDLRAVFAALTGDVISAYSYGQSYNTLDTPDFSPEIYRGFEATGKLSQVLWHFPWVIDILDALPYWLVKSIDPDVAGVVDRRKVIKESELGITLPMICRIREPDERDILD